MVVLRTERERVGWRYLCLGSSRVVRSREDAFFCLAFICLMTRVSHLLLLFGLCDRCSLRTNPTHSVYALYVCLPHPAAHHYHTTTTPHHAHSTTSPNQPRTYIRKPQQYDTLVYIPPPPPYRTRTHRQVFLRVRNLSDSARDLVIMFTEDPSGGCRRGGGGGGGRQQLSLEGSAVRTGGRGRSSGGGGGGAASVGSDSGVDDEGGAVKDISPLVSEWRV